VYMHAMGFIAQGAIPMQSLILVFEVRFDGCIMQLSLHACRVSLAGRFDDLFKIIVQTSLFIHWNNFAL
jgi:hypothetical protein